MIAPVVLAAAAAIQIHDDLVIAEFQLGDLHIVASIYGWTVGGNRTVEELRIERLANVYDNALFPGGQCLEGIGELAGDKTNQRQLRFLHERTGTRRYRFITPTLE